MGIFFIRDIVSYNFLLLSHFLLSDLGIPGYVFAEMIYQSSCAQSNGHAAISFNGYAARWCPYPMPTVTMYARLPGGPFSFFVLCVIKVLYVLLSYTTHSIPKNSPSGYFFNLFFTFLTTSSSVQSD